MEKWQSVDNAMAHRKEAREKPSKVSKEYLSRLMQQEIIESGKIAKTLCQQSGSREVGVDAHAGNKLYTPCLTCKTCN